jgi:hypothetical protein
MGREVGSSGGVGRADGAVELDGGEDARDDDRDDDRDEDGAGDAAPRIPSRRSSRASSTSPTNRHAIAPTEASARNAHEDEVPARADAPKSMAA